MGAESESSSSSNPTTDLPDAVVRSFERLLERHGNNSQSVGLLLFDENKQLRDQLRTLQGKVPGEGAVVLSGEEATAWKAYVALGKPDEIKQGLEQRTQLQGQLDALAREQTLRSIAEISGFKPSVLAQLDRMAKAQGKELAFSQREITQPDGKAVATAFVKDGATEYPLTDYAKQEWKDFLPALVAPTDSGSGAQGAPRFPTQHAGPSSPTGDFVSQFLADKEKTRSAEGSPIPRA